MTDATVQTIEPKTLESIRTVANIGSGTMGHATALQFAVAGYPVKLVDCSEELLKRGMEHIRADAEEFAQAGLLRAEDTVDDVLSRISTYTDYENGVSDADFIIESIVEKLDVKQSVWQQIEQYAPVDAIFATNTSGLGPTAIQSVLKHPERFVVAHFWNPAHLMPLVEVVPGKDTAPEVVDTTFDLMASIGKKPAKIKKESLGFVGNRMQLALLREAFNIINEGIADAETVDTVVTVWDDAGISSAPWPAPIWADWTRSTTSAPTCSKTWITAPNRALCWLGKCRMGTLAQKPAVVSTNGKAKTDNALSASATNSSCNSWRRTLLLRTLTASPSNTPTYRYDDCGYDCGQGNDYPPAIVTAITKPTYFHAIYKPYIVLAADSPYRRPRHTAFAFGRISPTVRLQ